MNQALIVFHLLGMAAGFASGIGNMVVGLRVAMSPADAAALRSLPPVFARIGQVGLAVLWITGAILIWSKWGGPADMPPLFWAKLALVAVFTGLVIRAAMLMRAVTAGDTEAGKALPMLGRAGGLISVVIVVLAVYALG